MTATISNRPPLLKLISDTRSKLEFGDGLLLVYLIAIVRQWFWIIDNRWAWIATVPIALVVWIYYVANRPEKAAATSFPFWLIVGLPLLAAYLLRFPFPDSSFDVWGLRLFHGERGLQGFLYLPGEFFPTAAPFNPTPDMVTGIFRQILGYRLGTVVNLIALLWTASVLDKILRPFVGRSALRAIAVLLIVFVEHLLFEINNYMPDLLALPLLLEATYLTLNTNVQDATRRNVVRVAFLIGMAVTLKLSNGAVAVPLVIVWVSRLLVSMRRSPKELLVTGLLSIVVVVGQLLPFSVWVYKLTGSPIFPLYNKVFRSPLYPPFNGWDDRWGGYGVLEVIAWPVIMFFKPVRTAELPVYSGRLSIGFIAALLCLVLARRANQSIRTIALILGLGTLLWSVTMGYIRYGLYLELLAGLLLVVLAATFLQRMTATSLKHRMPVALGVLLSILLIAQSTLAGSYLMRLEWSLRPTVFTNPARYQIEARNILRDRSIKDLLAARERELFAGVDVWVVSGVKTVGLMPFLNDKAHFVGARAAGLFLAPANQQIFETAIENFSNRRMASLAFGPDYNEALFTLRSVGLRVNEVEEVVILIFSADDPMDIYFLKVSRDVESRSAPTRTIAESRLPDNAYRASIESEPIALQAGQRKTQFFKLKNISESTWPAMGSANGKFQVLLRGRWLTEDGSRQVGEATESTLPYDLARGESTILPLSISAPAQPGTYVLEVDMVQRDGATFKTKGSGPFLNTQRVR